MELLVELPTLEEIYDFDTFTLRDLTDRISKQHSDVLLKLATAEGPVLSWKKKAERFIDLAVLELKEREVIENFGDFCAKQGQEQVTPALKAESETKDSTTVEEKRSFKFSTNNHSVASHANSNNANEISLPSIERKSVTLGGSNSKKRRQEELFAFMKETLASTRVQENRLVIGRSTVGKYKYVPPKKKKEKKEKKLKRSKTENYGRVVLPRIGKKEEGSVKKNEELIRIERREKEEKIIITNKNNNDNNGSTKDDGSKEEKKEMLGFDAKKETKMKTTENIHEKDAVNSLNLVNNTISNEKPAESYKNIPSEKNRENIETTENPPQKIQNIENPQPTEEHHTLPQKSQNIETNENLIKNTGKAEEIHVSPIINKKYEKNPLENFLKKPSENTETAQNTQNQSEKVEKIDFQAKYKDFVEKAKNFRPASLYEINESESGESDEEKVSEKQTTPLKNYNEKPIFLNKKEITPEEISPIKLDSYINGVKEKENRPKTHEENKKPLVSEAKIPKSERMLPMEENAKGIKPKPEELIKKEPIDTLKDSKKNLEQTLSKYKKPEKTDKTAQNPEKTEKADKIEKIRKPEVPRLPKPLAKPKLSQSKPGYDFDDSKLVDYSSFFPNFSSIFSGFYNNLSTPQNFDYIDVMKEIYNMFSQHVNRVDEVDRLLANKHKISLAPMELNPNEVLLLNEPKTLSYYAYRTNIDVRAFLARQEIFERKMRGELQEELAERTLYYRVVKNREEVYDIVSKSFMRKLNWAELPHGMNLKTSWNLLWTWSKPQIEFNKLLFWQKVNHFPLNKNLVRKDLLKKNIEKMQKLGAKTSAIYNFIPQTYVLPKEYCQFVDHFHHDLVAEGRENIWIMKPIGKSRGRGISLINDLSNVVYAEQVIVQKYLKNPLLLRGFKFDLRIYVLVTSIQPLEAFIYKEGFARLSTEPFSLDPEDLDKLFIHLTNVAINKNHVDVHRDCDTLFGGSKLSLKNLKGKLEERGHSYSRIWTQVCEIVVKSLLSCQNEIPSNPNCFELFGYDIIVDDNLKCWVFFC